MPTFHSNGALLHYEDSGDGRPVVFLHGCWMSSRFFTHQTAPGALPGCRVIAPDFRGHGRSEKPIEEPERLNQAITRFATTSSREAVR